MLSFQKRQGSSGVKSQKKIYRHAQIFNAACLWVKEGKVKKDHDGVPAFLGRHAQSFACQASCAVIEWQGYYSSLAVNG